MPDKTNNFARKAIRQIKHLLGDNRLAEEIRWRFKGKPSPPPGFVKQKILKTYAKNFALKTFVETGTGTGSTTWAMRNLFSKIYSVELNDELFKKAQIKFAAYPHVSLYQGDSAQILPSILTKINEPTLFWLDGHYSGESTSKGNLNTPILRELNLVLNQEWTFEFESIPDVEQIDFSLFI